MVLWLSVFTVIALMSHSVALIITMIVIDACAWLGWHA